MLNRIVRVRVTSDGSTVAEWKEVKRWVYKKEL